MYGPVVIFEGGSGAKPTKSERGPTRVEQNINEDPLRNQRCPVDRDNLMLVFHRLCCCSLFFKQKRHHCVEAPQRKLCKKHSLYNLNSYEGFSLPSLAQAKASGNKAPTLMPKCTSVPAVQFLEASNSTEPNSSHSTAGL